MRLIDYDAAIDRYYAEYEKQDICDGAEDRDFLKRCFDEAPTVDAAQVVHGRWNRPIISGTKRKNPFCYCTNCAFPVQPKRMSKYCPNCGAKMDLPEDGE